MNFLLALVLATISVNVEGIQEACAEVKMSCGYNNRYHIIDTIFFASKQVMFDKKSNPYTRDDKEEVWNTYDLPAPRYYIGTKSQNAKLARNILANKDLFENGKLTRQAAKKWKLVE